MPISFDATWLPSADGRTRVRQVYFDGDFIGRVRQWGQAEPGDWFTAERWANALYVLIEGTHPTFEEVLERIVFYGVAN